MNEEIGKMQSVKTLLKVFEQSKGALSVIELVELPIKKHQ